MGHYATAQQVWAAGLVFARLGAILMVIPGIGEAGVPPRVRLSFALLIAMCLGPIAAPTLPVEPATVDGTVGYIIREALVGLVIGGLLRLFLTSLSTAGEFISLATTLSFSQTANPMEAAPSTSISTFLTMMGIVLIFDTDLHQLFIAGMAHSYTLFPPTRALNLNDAGSLAAQTVSRSFTLGLQLSAPVVVFSLVINLAAGLVGRVMPSFQIFFVATPLTLLLGLSIFALSLGTIGMVWVQAYEAFARSFT